MIDIDALCRLISGLDPRELDRWIAERWVLPENTDGRWVFHDVDVARVRLIVELRRDLAIEETALPVVLGLMDQLYGARRRMKALAAVIEGLPPDIRAALKIRLNTPED